jgi:hypothetical protein
MTDLTLVPAELADLRRVLPEGRDHRIFAGVNAPLMAMERGGCVIKPMRNQCRPVGRPAFHDMKRPGIATHVVTTGKVSGKASTSTPMASSSAMRSART